MVPLDPRMSSSFAIGHSVRRADAREDPTTYTPVGLRHLAATKRVSLRLAPVRHSVALRWAD
jgi:hypothetical protein